jgi:hypothetical protein
MAADRRRPAQMNGPPIRCANGLGQLVGPTRWAKWLDRFAGSIFILATNRCPGSRGHSWKGTSPGTPDSMPKSAHPPSPIGSAGVIREIPHPRLRRPVFLRAAGAAAWGISRSGPSWGIPDPGGASTGMTPWPSSAEFHTFSFSNGNRAPLLHRLRNRSSPIGGTERRPAKIPESNGWNPSPKEV